MNPYASLCYGTALDAKLPIQIVKKEISPMVSISISSFMLGSFRIQVAFAR